MGKDYKVLPDWFKKTDVLGYKISTWCRDVNDKEVFCTICCKNIYCGSKGFQAITQHVATNVHKENSSIKLTTNQLHLKSAYNISSQPEMPSKSSDTSQLQMFCKNDDVMKAEIIWALKSVQHNMAASSCDDLKFVFSAMFPNSVSEKFQLGRTKLTYLITEALGPYFRQQTLKDARNSYYTLLFDETTNNADKKELQFKLRFWSESQQEISCKHLKTVFIGHATANDIVFHINETLNSSCMPTNKLIMLGSDGPNVNKKVWNLINQQLIEQRGYGLTDLGTCNIHMIHNAYQKGLVEYGDTACELVQLIYHFFKKYPSRWEDFEKCQKKKNVPEHRFIKHVPNRWLTLKPACERIIEQWEALREYFLSFLPNHDEKVLKTEKCRQIIKIVKFIDIKVELNFVVEASELYCEFLELFQRSEPLIHLLGSRITKVAAIIAGRICKAKKIRKITNFLTMEDLLKPIDIELGEKTKYEVNLLDEKEKHIICFKIQKHYIASYNYIYEKILNKNVENLTHFQYLQPAKIKDPQSLTSISKIYDLMPFLSIDRIYLKDEWRILQSGLENPKNEHHRIDHFWRNIINEKNDLGVLKYPNLNTFVKCCLALSHGNSDVERGFSASRRILSEEKSLMSEKVLNDRLIIKDALENFQHVGEVPITKELLNLAYGARKSYHIYLDNQKRIQEEKIKAQKEREEKESEEKLLGEKCTELKQQIKKLEEKARLLAEEKRETQGSADGLLQDANKKLKEAIKKKDFGAIRIAQGMMEGSLKLREKEREHENKETKINKIVNKRKQTLLEQFVNKRQKQ